MKRGFVFVLLLRHRLICHGPGEQVQTKFCQQHEDTPTTKYSDSGYGDCGKRVARPSRQIVSHFGESSAAADHGKTGTNTKTRSGPRSPVDLAASSLRAIV